MTSEHWESVHAGKGVDEVSWWQPDDVVWADLVEATGVPVAARVVDVGSGSSTLVDALVARGHTDVTIVDLSPTAVRRAVARVRAEYGDRAQHVRGVIGDVRDLVIEPQVDVWFDRAVFHFLTDPEDRAAYVLTMRSAIRPGGFAIVSTFAADGPETCSGLPVERYDADALVAALDAESWRVVQTERRVHTTPWGSEQPFTSVVLQRPS